MSKFLLFAFMIGISLLTLTMPLLAMEEGDDDRKAKTLPCLMNMPEEIHLMIARKFPPATLGALARVNQHWKAISEDNTLWRKFAEEQELTIPQKSLGLGEVKAKFKELSTAFTIIENGTESTLHIMLLLKIFQGPSIEEINKWRVNEHSSELVSCIERLTPAPGYEIKSGENIGINLDAIRQHFNLSQAQAYTGVISIFYINEMRKGDFSTIIIPNKWEDTNLMKHNKRDVYRITSSTNPRSPYTIELIN